MELSNLIQAISAGICLYAGIVHLFIGLKKEAQFKVHLSFALICLLFSLYNLHFFLFTIHSSSTSFSEIIATHKTEMGFLAFIIISLYLLHKIDLEEKMLRSKEIKTRALLNAPDDFILLFDPDGIINDVNESTLKEHRRTRSEMIGSCVWDLFPEETITTRKKYVNRVIALKKPIRFEDKRQNRWFDNIIYPLINQAGKVYMIAVFAKDITKSKVYEKKVKKRTALLRRAQQIGKIGHWSYNLKTKELLWSNEIYRLLGYSPQEIAATYPKFLDMVHPKDRQRVQKTYMSSVKTHKEYDFIYRIKTKNKYTKYVREKCITEFDKDNLPLKLFGTIQDITELKETEIDLIKAKEKAEESDKLKSAFLTNISHEIRTPMNAILGFSDLLQHNHIDKTVKKEYLGEIERGSKRMLNIISDLIDISKIESGQVKPNYDVNSINHMLDDIFTLFESEASSKNIKLVSLKSLPDEKSHIYFDKAIISKAIINLICNALKFTEKGEIIFGYTLKNSTLEFFVRDTGIGISKKMHNAIFENFRQVDISDSSRYEGAGLGLPISKAFIKAHKGKIWIDSEIGKGSQFFFTLPYNQVQVSKTNKKPSYISLSENIDNDIEEMNYNKRQKNTAPVKTKDNKTANFTELIKALEDTENKDTIKRNTAQQDKDKVKGQKNSNDNLISKIIYKKKN